MLAKTQDWETPQLDEHPISLHSIAWTAADNGAATSNSRHQKPLGLIIGLSNRKSLTIFKLKHTSTVLLQNFLFQMNSLLLTRELDDVDFKIALQ
jgi:hypothetical protein